MRPTQAGLSEAGLSELYRGFALCRGHLLPTFAQLLILGNPNAKEARKRSRTQLLGLFLEAETPAPDVNFQALASTLLLSRFLSKI